MCSQCLRTIAIAIQMADAEFCFYKPPTEVLCTCLDSEITDSPQACILTEAHLSGFTTKKPGKKPCSVKVVVHNVADRSMSFTCSEFGKGVKPILAEKGKWTAIGPIDVTVEKNSILHMTVTVGTGKRYGVVRKSMVINLLKLFQYNLEGSKFVVLTAIENAREQTLKIKIGRRVALTFNLY